MQYLKQNTKPEDLSIEEYVIKANQLRDEGLMCERTAFDMTVREVIDSGLIYKKCNHKYVEQNNGKGDFDRWGKLASFTYKCNQCFAGVNRHDCSIEGETYYMTCDEARVVNITARGYGINGSVKTATEFRD